MSYSAQNRLRDIAVRVVGSPSSPAVGSQESVFHRRRRVIQLLTLVLIALVPTSGLFRIDPMAGAVVVLNRQIWFADFFWFSVFEFSLRQ